MLSIILGLCAAEAFVFMWLARREQIRRLRSELQRAEVIRTESERKSDERLSECGREWQRRYSAMVESYESRLAEIKTESFKSGVKQGEASCQLVMRHHKAGENTFWKKSAGEIRLVALLIDEKPRQVYLDTERWKSTELPEEIKKLLGASLSAGATFIGSALPVLL